MGCFEFSLAYVVFFLSHSLPVRPPLRPWLQARLGVSGFTLAYSALSLAALAWLIVAAGRAPHVTLWDWAPWQVHVPLTVMGPVCLILALSIGRPNPFSFGGARNDRFDPARPGNRPVVASPAACCAGALGGGPYPAERGSRACDPVRHLCRLRHSWRSSDRPQKNVVRWGRIGSACTCWLKRHRSCPGACREIFLRDS